MRKYAKIITAVAFAGIAAASGSALTATGVTNNAGATQFIGGTVGQSVTGATLSNVAYGFFDTPTNHVVNLITLTFVGQPTATNVALTPTGGAGGTFNCADVAGAGITSVCTYVPGTSPDGYSGLDSIAIAVTEDLTP